MKKLQKICNGYKNIKKLFFKDPLLFSPFLVTFVTLFCMYDSERFWKRQPRFFTDNFPGDILLSKKGEKVVFVLVIAMSL